MAEGQKQTDLVDETQKAEPHGEADAHAKAQAEPTDATDWKAEARKWEARAKENKAKADAYDEAQEAAKSDLQKAIERAERAEAAVAEFKAEKEHADVVAKVAESTGLAASLVASLNGADEEALMEQARSIAALKPSGAPTAPEAGRFPRDAGGSKTTSQQFADAIDLF